MQEIYERGVHDGAHSRGPEIIALLAERDALRSRLAEAEALLRKCRGEIESQDGYLEQLCPRTDGFGGPHPALADIDAFLTAASVPARTPSE